MTTNRPVLNYYNIADDVTAFSTTRHGGCSKGNYGEFNVNEYCGDSTEAVTSNRKALYAALGIEADRLIMPHQTHSIEVRHIGRDFFALPDEIKKMLLDGVDGVMTDVPGVCVGVSTADCIPVLLYDEEHQAVCAVHAGWRGTASRIVQKALADMRAAFLTTPSKVKAVIGPGISLKNFEVGDEVYNQFSAGGFDMDRIARRYDKWHIDLPLCNRLQMEEAGVSPDTITDCAVCTYDNVADYFSARRLGTESGRIYNGILLNRGRQD